MTKRRELFDLSQHVGIDVFDEVMTAIEDTVENVDCLCLDDSRDRTELVKQLQAALGAVVDDDEEEQDES